MEIPVYNTAGELVDQVSVDEAALGGKPNLHLIRQAVLMYEANQRVGTANSKRRSEVIRSRRKPWRQKHTGRARHGDRGSPVWVGGGVAHGPRPRDYRQKMSKRSRRQALRSAFLAKALDGEVMAVDQLTLPEPKTREMAGVLRNLNVTGTFLIVLVQHEPQLWQCTRNIPGAAMTTWHELNAYEMIRPNRVIFVLEAVRQFLEAAVAAEAPQEEGAGVSADG